MFCVKGKLIEYSRKLNTNKFGNWANITPKKRKSRELELDLSCHKSRSHEQITCTSTIDHKKYIQHANHNLDMIYTFYHVQELKIRFLHAQKNLVGCDESPA